MGVFLIAMGEAGGNGEAAYVEGDGATKGEKGRLKEVALWGVCIWPCEKVVLCGTVSLGGCTARRRSAEGGGGGIGGECS